jgi:tetratricopeptide (TPR) repeat protein
LGADRDSEPAQEFEHRLQRFTRTWTAKRSEICEASQHSAGIEAALWNSVALCLDRQLARAMGTLRVITAEARLTDSDLRVFGEWLEAPRACIPSEPQAPTREQAGAVAEVEAGLLEIRTDRGRVPPYERIARLERLDARAQAANNPRLQAEVSFHLGLAYGSVANADAAREAYVRGLGHAERAGDDVLAIDIGVHLATRATAAADRALGILDVLHARAEGLALGPRVFALLETSRAQILAANERCGLALAAAQRAQDHLGREPREIDPLMRGVLLPRFVCLQAGGHHGQAFDTYREYADLSRRYSSNDREAIRLDTILGRLAVAAGRMDEAIAIADRNVNESRHLGREHSDLLAGSLALRAQLHRLMGEPERARRKLRAALEALAAADPGHDATAEIHLELAVLAAQLDRSYTYKQRAP